MENKKEKECNELGPIEGVIVDDDILDDPRVDVDVFNPDSLDDILPHMYGPDIIEDVMYGPDPNDILPDMYGPDPRWEEREKWQKEDVYNDDLFVNPHEYIDDNSIYEVKKK